MSKKLQINLQPTKTHECISKNLMHVLNYMYLVLSYPFLYLDMHIRIQSNLVLNRIIDF